MCAIYILHELLANGPDLLAEGGGEHHHLLAVRCVAEDFLHIATHVCKEETQKKWSIF